MPQNADGIAWCDSISLEEMWELVLDLLHDKYSVAICIGLPIVLWVKRSSCIELQPNRLGADQSGYQFILPRRGIYNRVHVLSLRRKQAADTDERLYRN